MRKLLIAAFVLSLAALPARAEVRVLSGGAVQEAMDAVVAAFRARTGAGVAVEYAPMGRLVQMLKAGDQASVLVMTAAALETATRDGLKLDGPRRPLGRSLLGIGVRAGAAVPDISTPEKVKALLLGAGTIAYIDPAFGTSGPHVVKMLETMGIAEQMKPRTRTLPGGRVAELVARGEADVVIHQVAEITPVKGVIYVGPLPAEINLITTYFVALTAGAGAEARALADFAVSPEGAAQVAQGGLTPGG